MTCRLVFDVAPCTGYTLSGMVNRGKFHELCLRINASLYASNSLSGMGHRGKFQGLYLRNQYYFLLQTTVYLDWEIEVNS